MGFRDLWQYLAQHPWLRRLSKWWRGIEFLEGVFGVWDRIPRLAKAGVRMMAYYLFAQIGLAFLARTLEIGRENWPFVVIGSLIATLVIGLLIEHFAFAAPSRGAKEGQGTTTVAEPVYVPEDYGAESQSLSQRVEQLEEARAQLDIQVIIEPYSNMMCLEVTNNGERGELQAQIEILEGRHSMHGINRPTLPAYTGYWERSAGPVAALPQGHKDRLLVGRREMAYGLVLYSYEFFYWDAREQCMKTYGTTSWVPLEDSGSIPPYFVFRITISSTPKMKDGPFVRDYVVDANLLRELVSDREGHLIQ